MNTSGRPECPYADTEQVAVIAARMRRPIDELMVITAAYTGMRWGELAGLDRDNVALDKGSIYVHPRVGALHEVGGKLFLGPPKTGDSVREIDLPPFLTDRIRRSLDGHEHSMVFPGARGGVRGIYSHVTPAMRQHLVDALQRRWESIQLAAPAADDGDGCVAGEETAA